MDPVAADVARPVDAAALKVAQAPSLAAFLGRLALALVVTFTAWHFAARVLSAAAAGPAAIFLEALPSIDRVRSSAGSQDVLLRVSPDYETQRRARMPIGAELEVTVTAPSYTYGIALFVALMLASWRRGSFGRLVVGLTLLEALAAGAIAADALQQLAQLGSAAGVPLFIGNGAAREALALAYQLSAIVVPTLAPLVAWAGLECDTLMALGRRW